MNQTNKNYLSPTEHVQLTNIDPRDTTHQTRHIDALRKPLQYKAQSDTNRNVKELAEELRTLVSENDDPRNAHLEPIVVIKNPDTKSREAFIIVTGFHRYYAYLWYNKMMAKKGKEKKVIKAKIFSGTPAEATLYAAGTDIRPNIPKNNEQKRNAAWELVSSNNPAAAKLSCRKLGTQCGVSKTLIATMRRTKAELDDNTNDKTHTFPNWKTQTWYMGLAGGEIPTNEEQDMDNKLEVMATQITEKYLGERLHGDKTQGRHLLRKLAKRWTIDEDALNDILPLESEEEPEF